MPSRGPSSSVGDTVEHIDQRGRITIKAAYRRHLEGGYVQVLTPEGVLIRRVSRRPLRTKAPALDDVDQEAMRDL